MFDVKNVSTSKKLLKLNNIEYRITCILFIYRYVIRFKEHLVQLYLYLLSIISVIKTASGNLDPTYSSQFVSDLYYIVVHYTLLIKFWCKV